MPSTFSTSLRLELIGNGEQAANWGNTTNTNLGTLLEQAITGVGSVVMIDADRTLTAANGVSDESRNAVLGLTSSVSLTATRNLIVPSVNKTYIVRNQTSGNQTVVVKTSAGTGVSIANGYAQVVYCDGTNVSPATLPYNSTTGNVNVSGSLSVAGTATITGATTMNGDLTVSKATPTLTLSKASSGQNNVIAGTTSGSLRWNIRLGDDVSESGSDAGSNFSILRFTDAQAYIDTPLSIARSTGVTTINTLSVAGAASVTGALGVSGTSTMSGDVAINKNTPQLSLNKTASGQNNLITGTTNGSLRWIVLPGNDTAESGTATGSDFGINSYNNTGTYTGTPLTINRASGQTTLTSLSVNNTITAGGEIVAGNGYIRIPEATGGGNSRYVHNNSGTIGFLNASSAWVLRAADNGNVTAAGNLIAGNGGGGYVLSGVSGYNYGYTGDSVQLAGNGDASVFSKNTTANANQIVFNNPNGQVGFINTDGSSTSFGTGSDYRLKKDVQPMTNGLATISALKPSVYKWIVSGASGEGFIAHELQEVVPRAVIGEKDATNEDGSIRPQGVDYSKIVVHLVAAMQEQQKQIQELTAKVDALEAKGS
jgi:hypothetical protein